MFRDSTDFPPITKRIKDIVDNRFGGNVRQFALAMGMSDSVKINRLFKKDKRNDVYPMPSTDVIIQICNTFNESADWILLGKSPEEKTTNNINIERNTITGNNNVQGENNTQSNENLLEVIKTQQEQINKLLNLLSNGQ